jgi:hypothetical protein
MDEVVHGYLRALRTNNALVAECPERVKALLQSNVLFLLNSKEARPDLFGHIGQVLFVAEAHGSSSSTGRTRHSEQVMTRAFPR